MPVSRPSSIHQHSKPHDLQHIISSYYCNLILDTCTSIQTMGLRWPWLIWQKKAKEEDALRQNIIGEALYTILRSSLRPFRGFPLLFWVLFVH